MSIPYGVEKIVTMNTKNKTMNNPILLIISICFTITTAAFGQITFHVYDLNDSLKSQEESTSTLNYFITGEDEEGALGESVVIIETDLKGSHLDTTYHTIVEKYSDEKVLKFTVIDDYGVKFIMMFFKKLIMVSYTFHDRYVLIDGDLNY